MMSNIINNWTYDYTTATYLLLFYRKQQGLPLKLTSFLKPGDYKMVRINFISEAANSDKRVITNLQKGRQQSPIKKSIFHT